MRMVKQCVAISRQVGNDNYFMFAVFCHGYRYTFLVEEAIRAARISSKARRCVEGSRLKCIPSTHL